MLLLVILFSIALILPKHDNPDVLSSIAQMEEVILSIAPPLDFSVFSPYTISATNIPDTPDSVTLNLSVDMGDDNECWDFFVDGSCGSQPLLLPMTFDQPSNSYKRIIYPDQIYPEIFFADSKTTIGNFPLETPIRRNDYHLFYMVNHFEMVSGMNFWIEFNAIPVSISNSADIQIYLIDGSKDITFFNTNWFNESGVELVGTLGRNSTFHHTHHPQNSSHHLVRLSTNSDGSIGNNSLNISNGFWIVLFSNSPNNSRGWNLRYQPSELCDNSSNWYRGNFSGWTTTHQQGCPDSHIHISRSNINYIDTVKGYVSATYGSDTYNSLTETFSFTELPNLPPNPTSFVSPTVGSIYRGNVTIQWNPTTDPNPQDTLTYTISLTKTGEQPTALTSNSSGTSYLLDTSMYENGQYILSGEVCDNLGLCTPFTMDGTFTIDNVIIPETISSITISSTNGQWAKDGDTVAITFEVSGTIPIPNVDIYSGGDEVTNVITVTNTQGSTWVASYVVDSLDTDGDISFEIYSSNLEQIYYQTTNGSTVTVDTTPPPSPISSLSSGEYTDQQEVTLSAQAGSTIKYVIDGESVDCSSGILSTQPILLNQDSTVKAVACDLAGNQSSVATYIYTIRYSLDNISISSSNINNSYAKVGDTITLSFTCSYSIDTPNVLLFVNDQPVIGDINTSSANGINWVSEYVVHAQEVNGLVSFEISSLQLYTTFRETFNLSRVTVDTLAPTIPVSNISTGRYISSQTVSFVSSGSSLIRYTLDGSTPSCLSGLIYLQPLTIVQSRIIKAVACDFAFNQSPLLELLIAIFPDTVITPPTPTSNTPPTIPISQTVSEEEIDDISQDIEEEETVVEEKEIVVKRVRVIPTLKVRILDKDLNPVPNLTVTIRSKPQTGVTDSSGIVLFTNIPLGTHTVVYSKNNKEYTSKILLDEEYIQEMDTLEIIDIVTQDDTDTNVYLLYIGIFLFILVVFLVVKTLLKKNDSVDY